MPEINQGRKANVAVIGAGPAGLIVAHELLKEGHAVTIFEAGNGVGGAWLFDSSTDSDLSALLPNRTKVHSSMYPDLRTNLPRHVMTFLDFPFLPSAMAGRSHDPRKYPLHTEVQAYCEAFADAFGLRGCINFNTKVLRVDPVSTTASAAAACYGLLNCNAPCLGACCSSSSNGHNGSSSCTIQQATQHSCSSTVDSELQSATLSSSSCLQWRLIAETCRPGAVASAPDAAAAAGVGAEEHDAAADEQQRQPVTLNQQVYVFDTVASCVGNFSEPNHPQVQGMDSWPGLQVHCHNYRGPEQFKGLRVMVVGASFSGEEIARQIATVAPQVYHSARTFTGPGTARELTSQTRMDTTQLAASRTDITVHADGETEQHQQHYQPEEVYQHQQQQPPQQLVAGQAHSEQQQQRRRQACQQQQATLQQQEHVSTKITIPDPPQPRDNILRVPMLKELRPDGTVVCKGSKVVEAFDAIVYCTGYQHTYPWLEHLNVVQTGDGHVRPLYMHLFPPAFAPSLAIIGLPWRCAKMPQMQLQGQLLARVLSRKTQLPSVEEMMQDQQRTFDALAAAGIPRRYTHCMASFMPQDEWAYANSLVQLTAGCSCSTSSSSERVQTEQLSSCKAADNSMERKQCHYHDAPPPQQQQQHQCCNCIAAGGACGSRPLLVMPDWFRAAAKAAAGGIMERPDTFRDEWDDEVEAALQEAERHMKLMLPAGHGPKPL